MEMQPFGTIESQFCPECCNLVQDEDGFTVHQDVRKHVLGGDDEWYCEVCDKQHFDAIVAYYTK